MKSPVRMKKEVIFSPLPSPGKGMPSRFSPSHDVGYKITRIGRIFFQDIGEGAMELKGAR